MNEHIPDGELLRAADGELSKRRTVQINTHLQECWSCRTRMRDLEGTIDEFVHIHIEESAQLIPTIDGPRALLRARIAALEETEDRRWWEFLWFPARWRISIAYAAGASVIVAAAVLFIASQRNISAVSASEVLSKAERSEKSELQRARQPVVYQKVRIKVGEQRFARTIYNDTTGARHVDHLESIATPVSDREMARMLAPVERAFSEAKLDWQAPLSPSRFSDWRSGLRVKTEQIRGERGVTEIQTTTPEGLVAEATLTLRNSDFHPISESLRLRDSSIVEIAELDYAVLELSQLSSSLFDSAPPVNAESVPEFATAPITAGGALELELDIVKRLDQVDAFLGGQIAVQRNRGAIVVQGVVDDRRRKSEILQALGPVLHNPALRVEIVVPGEGRNHAAPKVDDRVRVEGIETFQSPPADASLRAYLAKKSGSVGDAAEEVQRFTNEVLLHSQSARAHALALKQIAERFSPDDLNGMTPDEHRQWRAMLNGHARAILVETRAMREKLEPIFRSNLEDQQSRVTNLKSDADLVDAAARLSDLAAANDNAVWHSFAASTQESRVTLVCLPEFWESLLNAEILAGEISTRAADGDLLDLGKPTPVGKSTQIERTRDVE